MNIVTVQQTVVYNIDWISLARELQKRILRDMQNNISSDIDADICDLDMNRMYAYDCAVSLEVCQLLSEGDWPSAKIELEIMDTKPRERLYDLIGRIAGDEFFDAMQ